MMEPAIRQFLIGGFIYVIGASLFVTRVPERCKPGCFDYFGHSH
jgi:adiponectin receptor